MNEVEIKEYLRNNNDEFKRLEQKHRKYEEELQKTSSHMFVSLEQQKARKDMKKLKLRIKDKMQEMIASYRDQLQN